MAEALIVVVLEDGRVSIGRGEAPAFEEPPVICAGPREAAIKAALRLGVRLDVPPGDVALRAAAAALEAGK